MKKVLFAALSICLAAAAAIAPLSVSAAEVSAMPEYPDEVLSKSKIIFTNLTDFAVASDSHLLFVDSGSIVHLENETPTVYTLEASVTDVDYDGEYFYYSFDYGKTSYIFPYPIVEQLEPSESVEHDFTLSSSINVFDNYNYFYSEGALYVTDYRSPEENVNLGNFIKTKIYDGRLFGSLKTSGGETIFHEITGTTTAPCDKYISTYNRLTKISVGDVPEKLRDGSRLQDETQLEAQFVQIDSKASITEIDVNNLITEDDDGNRYFTVINPSNVHSELKNKKALLLCEAGNIRIVAYGRSAYMVKTDWAPVLQDDGITSEPAADGTKATYNTLNGYAHALPFMSNATQTFKINYNEEVTVLKKISKDSYGIFGYEYYLIKNSKGECGYVISNFLNINQPPINENQTNDISSEPTYENSVRTVILVIVVIALALTAVGYLTFISTSGKRKTAKTKNDEGSERTNGSTDSNNKK